MKYFRPVLIALCGIASLSVAACGDDGEWQVVMVRNQVPYTEERTAGPGVAYVRAHLMPEKGPVLIHQTDVIKDASPIFDAKMKKK